MPIFASADPVICPLLFMLPLLALGPKKFGNVAGHMCHSCAFAQPSDYPNYFVTTPQLFCNSPPAQLSAIPVLFHGHRLGQVARFVDVGAAGQGGVVGE